MSNTILKIAILLFLSTHALAAAPKTKPVCKISVTSGDFEPLSIVCDRDTCVVTITANPGEEPVVKITSTGERPHAGSCREMAASMG